MGANVSHFLQLGLFLFYSLFGYFKNWVCCYTAAYRFLFQLRSPLKLKLPRSGAHFKSRLRLAAPFGSYRLEWQTTRFRFRDTIERFA